MFRIWRYTSSRRGEVDHGTDAKKETPKVGGSLLVFSAAEAVLKMRLELGCAEDDMKQKSTALKRNKAELTLKLEVVVDYTLYGTNPSLLTYQLVGIINDAYANGQFTGETDAEMEGFDVQVRNTTGDIDRGFI